MIRPATEDDVDGIVQMSHEFYKTTGYMAMVEMDYDSVADLTRGLIDNGVMLVACNDGDLIGMVGMAVAPFLFNSRVNVAYEVVWYVTPGARGGSTAMRLLREMEKHCSRRKVAAIQMFTLNTSPEIAARLYENAGYTKSETCFTKEL